MVVTIDQIREKGLTLDEPVSLALLTEALEASGASTIFKASGPSQLHATFFKVSGGVLMEGSLQVDLDALCKRCLADVKMELPVAFALNLIPASAVKAAQEVDERREDSEDAEAGGSFGLDAADQEVFDGKTIELDPIIREQVMLALPMGAVCREDCQGLCAQCGQNLNEAKCGCEQRVVDPRLMALKNIKLN